MDIELEIKKVISLEEIQNYKESSCKLHELLFHLVRQQDPLPLLSKVFIILRQEDLSTYLLITLLRTTSAYKNDINLWLEFYNMTKNKVLNMGLNPSKELYGLDHNLKSLLTSKEILNIDLITLTSYSNTSFKTVNKTSFINL